MGNPRVPIHYGMRHPRESVEGIFGRPGLDLRTELVALIDTAIEEAKTKHLAIDWGSIRIEGSHSIENREVRLSFFAEGEDTRDPMLALADALADAERVRQRSGR